MIINLSDYAPVIGDVLVADKILKDIKHSLTNDGESVIVDFSPIRVIATNCAKHIFGRLYVDMGGESFFSRIVVINASENVKVSILNGIEAAIQDMNDN